MDSLTPKYQEPELEDLFGDPVLLAVLKRDGLTIDDVKEVIQRYQEIKLCQRVTLN
ncbi:hypothetical protein [Sneathiella limimaris]|uniref:hypothetical protein n=1 Tax=Sneathiella limimaris TaxID=1964213 RepID=UPI00146DA618|nr:hypothetical protein [Sneathiella limimaris]